MFRFTIRSPNDRDLHYASISCGTACVATQEPGDQPVCTVRVKTKETQDARTLDGGHMALVLLPLMDGRARETKRERKAVVPRVEERENGRTESPGQR